MMIDNKNRRRRLVEAAEERRRITVRVVILCLPVVPGTCTCTGTVPQQSRESTKIEEGRRRRRKKKNL